MPRKFLILMMGYTGVGKSTLANRLSKLLNVHLFHSAVVRKEMGFTPRTKEEADKFFDYRNNLRKDVDKKVYGKMADMAELSLKNGRNVILDAGHFFSWQRKNIYKKAMPLNVDIFIVRVVCKDEREIKRRFKERAERFGDFPLDETPSWNAYISTKMLTEPPEEDRLLDNKTLNIIEYDNLNEKLRFVQGNKNSENSKRILNAIIPREAWMSQDKNFKFVEIEDNKLNKIVDLNDNFVIVLDFDGVITSPYKLKTQYINEFGYNISEEQCGYDTCIRKLGVEKKHYENALLKAFTEEPEKLPLKKNFMKNFLKIKNLNNVLLFIITSRHSTMLKHLEEYLKYHKIRVDGIINTKNQNKLESLKKIKANIFVEDSPFRLSQIFSEKKNLLKKCTFILFRNKANKIEKSPDKSVLEVLNWNDLYKVVIGNYKAYTGS